MGSHFINLYIIMMTTCVISLFLVLSFLPHLIPSFPPMSQYRCNRALGPLQLGRAYEINRNELLRNFSSDTEIDFGYYTSSVGEGPDKVYGQGLCRGDLEPDDCMSCLNEAKTLLPKTCRIQKDAFLYHDVCSFHYSNTPLQGLYLDPSYSYPFNNQDEPKDATSYTNALNDLMQRLKSQASSGGDDYKVAVGSETSAAATSETVYGLAQCMPDLSRQDCDACLENAISQIPRCCLNKVGGRVIKYSCNLRFERVHFYSDNI